MHTIALLQDARSDCAARVSWLGQMGEGKIFLGEACFMSNTTPKPATLSTFATPSFRDTTHMDHIVRLRRRPFLIRLRNHYRNFRRIGLSRYEALRGALLIAR